jgi:hypothetical protein
MTGQSRGGDFMPMPLLRNMVLIVVMPSWFKAPPASFVKVNQYGGAEARFWAPVQGLTFLALLLALILNWNDPPRRTLLLVALSCYVLVAIATAVYFAPKIIAWSRMNPGGVATKELLAEGHRWLALSWIRQALQLVADISLLIALTISKG